MLCDRAALCVRLYIFTITSYLFPLPSSLIPLLAVLIFCLSPENGLNKQLISFIIEKANYAWEAPACFKDSERN